MESYGLIPLFEGPLQVVCTGFEESLSLRYEQTHRSTALMCPLHFPHHQLSSAERISHHSTSAWSRQPPSTLLQSSSTGTRYRGSAFRLSEWYMLCRDRVIRKRAYASVYRLRADTRYTPPLKRKEAMSLVSRKHIKQPASRFTTIDATSGQEGKEICYYCCLLGSFISTSTTKRIQHRRGTSLKRE